MSIVRKDLKASLRITTPKQKTLRTILGVKPNCDPDDAVTFADTFSVLRGGENNGFLYLNVTTVLEDVL